MMTVARSYAVASSAGNASQGNWIARGMTTNVLLLQAPAEFDGIEVLRIWREVDDLDADRFAERYDTPVVVSAEIIEDEDIARIEPGQELSGEPENEAILVGAGEHRAEHDPSPSVGLRRGA